MRAFVLWASLAAGALSLSAQSGEAPKEPPVSVKAQPKIPSIAGSPLDDVLPGWLKIGGVLRGRFEEPSGIGFAPVSDGYYASRLRLNITVRPLSWVTLYTEVQDSRMLGYSRGPVAPVSFYNPADFRQAYIQLSSIEKTGMAFTAGRQEVNLGAGRLISCVDFNNSGRTFDMLRFVASFRGVRSEMFGGSVVLADSNRIDRHKPGEHLYGSYFTLSRLIPLASVEPYLIVKTSIGAASENGKIGNADAWTPGIRLAGKAIYRFDYSADAMLQYGHYAQDHIKVMAGAYMLGWTYPSQLKPRVALEYVYASGDTTNNDGVRGTFDQLYAGNHGFMGITDQTGWKNIRMPKALFEISPTPKLKLTADFRELYLASVNDGYYLGNGNRSVLNRAATSPHVGSEIDLVGSYQLPYQVNVSIGYGRLTPGQFLIQSKKTETYNFPYFMWAKRF